MTLEQQCVSLELAKRMKELGVKQDSSYYWEYGGKLSKGFSSILITREEKHKSRFSSADSAWSYYSAFTSAELGEMLPIMVKGEENKMGFLECYKFNQEYWECGYEHYPTFFKAKTEADARAKMLIHLKENHLI